MNKKILFLILLLIITALPVSVFAEASTGKVPDVLKDVLANIRAVIQAIGTAMIVVGFVVAGIMYLMSGGSDQRMSNAKKALIASLIGAVIVILAYATKGIETIIKEMLNV